MDGVLGALLGRHVRSWLAAAVELRDSKSEEEWVTTASLGLIALSFVMVAFLTLYPAPWVPPSPSPCVVGGLTLCAVEVAGMAGTLQWLAEPVAACFSSQRGCFGF